MASIGDSLQWQPDGLQTKLLPHSDAIAALPGSQVQVSPGARIDLGPRRGASGHRCQSGGVGAGRCVPERGSPRRTGEDMDEKRVSERMTIRFDGRVAVVTGAGGGLGRAHALGLAARGARVVVNDLGGDGAAPEAALRVVAEIEAAGGTAMADGADVTRLDEVAAMVARAEELWGRVDILVNNAGILADRSFAKMDMAAFRRVVEVHLLGSANCTKAVWDGMRARNYGRVVFTTSSSGLFGNFGQANYGAAKAALVGLMNVLHLEGEKHEIRVNALAPMALTAMTDGLFSPADAELLKPEAVTPALLFLVGEDAPSRTILGAGAGSVALTRIVESPAVFLGAVGNTPEGIAAQWAEMSRMEGSATLDDAFSQSRKFVHAAHGGASR